MSEKFEGQFEKVVGGSPEEKRLALETIKSWAQKAGSVEKQHERYELQKSESDIALIGKTETSVDEMVIAWGGNPAPFPADKMHLVSPLGIEGISEGEFRGGLSNTMTGEIFVEKSGSEIKTCAALAHELFHQKSYKSAQVYERRKNMGDYMKNRSGAHSVKLYRSGVQVVSREKFIHPGEDDIYFQEMEEAIVAKSEGEFINKILRKDPQYADAFSDVEKVVSWLEKTAEFSGDALVRKKAGKAHVFARRYIYAISGPAVKELLEVLAGPNDDAYKYGFFCDKLDEMYKSGLLTDQGRTEEIEKLDSVMEEIVSKSAGKFKTKEEVFDVFARANYSGNLLSLGKMIERILGKGSFRRIAENSKKRGRKKKPTQRIKEFFG
ncbi:MAG: hypothetical protein Q7S36_01520 [Candidatus Liptonbacteria bacterium]|nr:hypothetical protein [Candidatus Liptonbacteria bacterium]